MLKWHFGAVAQKNKSKKGTFMKTIVVTLLILLLSFPSCLAKSLWYYPEKKCDASSESDLAITAGICGAWTMWGVFEFDKIDRISKKPLLSDEDVRKLKREKWRSQLFVLCRAYSGD